MVNQSNRLISLDMFRGFTIALMILVNNPGDWQHVYSPLLHAKWNGWTPTDLVFPFFLFIVGVAISLSFSKRMEMGDTFLQLFSKVGKRTVLIFVIGLLLTMFPFFKFSLSQVPVYLIILTILLFIGWLILKYIVRNDGKNQNTEKITKIVGCLLLFLIIVLFVFYYDFSDIRIPGVLQRIAICYFFASLIFLLANKKWQIGWTAFLLVIYWLLIKLVPLPGFGAGMLDNPAGNLCWYIDSHLLAGHTWSGAPAPGFDPEGIFSTLPAIATVMFGIFTGDWIRSKRDSYEKVSGLFVAGNIGLVLGIIMNVWLPINKNLWTSSYTVFMAGMAAIFLAMSYWIIDIKGFSGWTKPFVVFGSNAITVFALSGVIAKATFYIKWLQPDGSPIVLKTWMYQNLFQSWAGDYFGSLVYPIVWNLIFLGLMWILYWKKIFIKV